MESRGVRSCHIIPRLSALDAPNHGSEQLPYLGSSLSNLHRNGEGRANVSIYMLSANSALLVPASVKHLYMPTCL
jgi:hypothetical protein